MYELNRKQDESFFDYCERLIEAKENNLIDIDKSEIWELLFSEKVSSDHARKCLVAVKKTISKLKDEGYEGITEESLLRELELKKQELYKERSKFFDQRRELNNILRQQSREEYLIDYIKNIIENSELKSFEYFKKEVKLSDNDLLVFLTDCHYGLECNNYWNKYNPEIFVKYLKKYLDEIFNIKKLHNSENCYLFLGGDLISGLIHNLTRIENVENVIEQVQHVSEYISNFVYELSKEFKEIYIHNVAGNHSRLMQNKKEDIKDEKLDLLIPWYMKARLSNLLNIFIVDNRIDNTIASLDIRGKLYLGVHGSLDSPGKVVNSLTQMINIKPYAILMAHRHHFSIDTEHNVKIINSGSFSSVDDFCITKRLSSNPSQTVCVCDENGLRCVYDIILK